MDFFIFFNVFGLLFLGELGDKTQLIIFNLSLEHKKSYKIGIGASLGFAFILSLSLIFGTLITQYVPIFIISIISGIVFIIIGLFETKSLKSIYMEKRKEKKELICYDNRSRGLKLNNHPYLCSFLSILIMELGDKSQILTITLALMYNLPFEVWFGAFFALISLTWIGVFFGAIITEKIPKFYIKLISIILFIVIGIIIILTSI
ncbi:MAG: TMEM165/GDT1 family protein [Candidatus Lokiarchaeota archaeon]|nr:TMEM165/GDT1 family protein [Candidatus Lokiarchaeota archaeon]